MKRTVKISCILLSLLMMLSFASCDAASNADMEGFGGGLSPSPSNPNAALPEKDYTTEDAVAEDDAEDEYSNPMDVFEAWVENEMINTEKNNVSTFSADVDTASYTYFRKLINQGYTWNNLKASASVFRTEEFINYFDYKVDQPKNGELFGVRANIVDCPWNEEAYILRMTLQAENAVRSKGNNLVFLIDVSGSMNSRDKLPLLKTAFSYLIGSLDKNDRVSIVTYSGSEKVVLDGCEGNKSEQIMNAINNLTASGSTNGEAGLTQAYRIAEKNYIEGGNNRIIMASDGDLNVGISSADELKKYISDKKDQGVYLSVLGFGTGNYRDSNMEALADNGNGVYYYIDGESEAEKVMGTDLLGTLYTVAEDVKMQLTFDKKYIASYRLIGYENRLLNAEDFEDDTKDAGEVGAGHQVTVCYEIILTDYARENLTLDKTPWINFAVRYKNPGQSLSLLNEYKLGADNITYADDDMKFLLSVVETSLILHSSKYTRDRDISGVIDVLNSLDLEEYPEREEFRNLLITAYQQ